MIAPQEDEGRDVCVRRRAASSRWQIIRAGAPKTLLRDPDPGSGHPKEERGIHQKPFCHTISTLGIFRLIFMRDGKIASHIYSQ